jgi:hypothetical protein
VQAARSRREVHEEGRVTIAEASVRVEQVAQVPGACGTCMYVSRSLSSVTGLCNRALLACIAQGLGA